MPYHSITLLRPDGTLVFSHALDGAGAEAHALWETRLVRLTARTWAESEAAPQLTFALCAAPAPALR